VQTVTIEDQTSALLCTEAATLSPSWNDESILKHTLIHYAEQGDVQTAVCILMVLLSTDSLNSTPTGQLLDENLMEYWFLSYIEMLRR
jgi:hypothetical protein